MAGNNLSGPTQDIINGERRGSPSGDEAAVQEGQLMATRAQSKTWKMVMGNRAGERSREREREKNKKQTERKRERETG
eukprot:6453578-Pyramimonas_sp.AAC.1